ncbi:hypothetical protein [Sphingomonas sp.]|uniref:hypothetical protein n=1 Tax=Sphingomonas sp. TaxID=28214 RepID=UPI003752CB57
MTTDKVERAIARFDRITETLDARDGTSRDAARRERQRLNAGFGRTAGRVGIAIAAVGVLTIFIGLFMPIGMFGFLAAVALAVGLAALLIAMPVRDAIAPPNVGADLPNGPMVERFDSYLFRSRRALPAPAQTEVDKISAMLPRLKETLARVESLDPAAQDARRLMSLHLPGLIDRYVHVPAAYRDQADGEGVSLEQRLVDGLAAGRGKLEEVADNLAKSDVAAFETQGRFIKARYGESDGPTGIPPQ